MAIISRRSFCASVAGVGAASVAPHALTLRKHADPTGTAYAYHPDFQSFYNNIAETHRRALWINSQLTLCGVAAETVAVTPYATPMEYILKVHTQSHIDSINRYTASQGFTLTMGQAAQTAVGYVLGAVDAVCNGKARNAFCCIRPPGHHVQNSGALGYCCYANVVCAAKFAREKHAIQRILIIDWDFHQGNGTHGHICGDSDILFFDIYNPPMYSTLCDDYAITGPGYAYPDDARRISIQMPSGSNNDDFVRVFENQLVSAAERFQPQLVLISCGFDLKKFDSHGSFLVTAQGVSRLTRIVRQIAQTYAGGRLVSMLEGGYVDTPRDNSVSGTGETFSGLAQCAENHVKTLMTGDEQPETPFFSATSTISMRRGESPVPRVEGGQIVGIAPGDGPFALTVADIHGRIVRSIVASNEPISLRGLAQGRYVVSIRGRRKTIVRVMEMGDGR